MFIPSKLRRADPNSTIPPQFPRLKKSQPIFDELYLVFHIITANMFVLHEQENMQHKHICASLMQLKIWILLFQLTEEKLILLPFDRRPAVILELHRFFQSIQ